MGKAEKQGRDGVRKALTAMRELLAWQGRLVEEALGELGEEGGGRGRGRRGDAGMGRGGEGGGGTRVRGI